MCEGIANAEMTAPVENNAHVVSNLRSPRIGQTFFKLRVDATEQNMCCGQHSGKTQVQHRT